MGDGVIGAGVGIGVGTGVGNGVGSGVGISDGTGGNVGVVRILIPHFDVEHSLPVPTWVIGAVWISHMCLTGLPCQNEVASSYPTQSVVLQASSHVSSLPTSTSKAVCTPLSYRLGPVQQHPFSIS